MGATTIDGGARLRAGAALAAAILAVVAWPVGASRDAGVARFLAPETVPQALEPMAHFAEDEIAAYADGVAHSPTITAYDDGELVAVWFRGETEAGVDVALHLSRRGPGGWSPLDLALSAAGERAEGRQFVRTIGNPALWRGNDDATWLAYVTPALGGWSTSRISLKRSADRGRTFGPARELRLSPFFNMSHLARFPALPMTGGRFGLPVYSEFIRAGSEIAVLDGEGRVVDRRRIGGVGDNGIQADLLWLSDDELETFLRPFGSMLPLTYRSASGDGGLGWSDPAPTDWPNPSAPVCSERFADGSAVLASNESEGGRRSLTLRFRPAGEEAWRRVHPQIVGQSENDRLSYCSFALAPDGVAHMVYSRWSDRSIRHVEFNRRWLDDHSRVQGE